MPDFTSPRVVVAGAGGMGALFGAILNEGGLKVTLYDTDKAHVAAILERGLRISGYGGDRTVAIVATTEASDIARADIVLFQCKSHGTRQAAQALKHLQEGGAAAISFQNGLGNEAEIAAHWGGDHVLGGLTQMAGTILEPGAIRDFSRVPSWIGEMSGGQSDRVDTIAKTFTAAGLETHASTNVVRDIWKKLLGNIAMSAVSGATNLTSADALAVAELRALSESALDEALMVAAAQGIQLDRASAMAGMEAISVKGGTGDTKSSLCVDILNKRPTEVEFIYGSVIKLARQHGLKTPVLDTLRAIVKGLERHYMQGTVS